MALAVDSKYQSMNYDAMRYQQPHFTNPWVSAPASNPGQMYATSMPATTLGSDPQRYAAHAPNVSSSAYSGAQLPTGIHPVDPELLAHTDLQYAQDGMTAQRPYGAAYPSTGVSSAASYAPVAASHYAPAQSYSYQADRRPSHPLVASTMVFGDFAEIHKQRQDSMIDMDDRFHASTEAQRQGFSDALDASRGMLQMSQSDITPRNIYGNDGSSRSSTDSYGFPSSHSSHSSISSASTYPTYYNSSVSEASVGDYSSATESVDMPSSRTLPRPQALIGGAMPPAPQSMMGQFSSKVSSSSQKKHKCKICDKRFTRPSSLQTHMYSHTGEKPFACDVEGCGRHFSVVSNLRRHRKVHKGDGRDPGSPDDEE